VRALLIVNPHATSTTRPRRDLIVRALASAVDLEVVETRYRGEATRLAASAAAEKFGLVMTLGGDGTVNEAVNGLLTPANGLPPAPAAALPALAAIPGGNANVFARSLRLPEDPVDATARLIQDLAEHRERCIGLGTANGRFFTFNAGLGLDAEVVRAVEGRRALGRALTPALFTRMALRQYYRITDRRRPAITISRPAELSAEAVFNCIVSNSAPWTYLGRRPVNTNPDAGFDTGLDLFVLRSLNTPSTLRTLRQMLSDRRADRGEPPRGTGVLTRHDLDEITLEADRPVAFQVDGEYMGETERVEFRAVPAALRVIGLPVARSGGDWRGARLMQ
jgi:diacylglycerol kinase family enzyme